MERKSDIVLLGATGYTGRLCVEYMAKTLPHHVTWCIAGRNKAKLEALRQEMGLDESKCLIHALDPSSEPHVTQLAKSARVIINVIGPYASTCGSAVIKACAENGTDYVDCSGEMPWLQDMIQQYDEIATKTKAKIIVTSGWGAVPADLSTLLAVEHIRTAFSLPTREVLVLLDQFRGGFSGGSIGSLCDLLGSYTASRIREASAPFALSPVAGPDRCRRRPVFPGPNLFGVRNLPGLGALVPTTQAGIEEAIVGRSWGLYAAQHPGGYGPNFSFSSSMRFPNVLAAWAFHVGFLLLNAVLAHISPLRTFVSRRLFPAGTGPTAEQRKGNHFTYRTIGIAETPQVKDLGSKRVEVDFAYAGDPYAFTATALTQAALLLLEGGTPAHERGGGILTSASLGNSFVQRLKLPEAGVKIDIRVAET